MTTVFFATNRVLSGDTSLVDSYTARMQPADTAAQMVYGSAFIDGVDIDTNNPGTIDGGIQETALGRFPDSAIGDIGDGGRNLLIFIHGFDNNFSDALTRGALNQAWLAAEGTPATDATIISFSWPSSGQIFGLPFPDSDYKADQNMARQSANHFMHFLANLAPILTAARANGKRTLLLAHSMGNLALQGAVEAWCKTGQGSDLLFDVAALAAPDCSYDTFNRADLSRLSFLPHLAGRTSIYYSHADDVLKLSEAVNFEDQRLGQDGPKGRADGAAFPSSRFTMVDATGFDDYDRTFLASHQYYRLSKACRKVLAKDMAG